MVARLTERNMMWPIQMRHTFRGSGSSGECVAEVMDCTAISARRPV